MLRYFKGYIAAACLVSLLLPAIFIAVYLWGIDVNLTSSITGWIAILFVFLVSLLFSFRIFENIAQRKANSLVDIYNEDCDPKLFIKRSKGIAHSIKFPCKPQGVWFMSCFGQACLDAGEVDGAKAVLDGLLNMHNKLKQPLATAMIAAFSLPLIAKMKSLDFTKNVAQHAYDLIKEDVSPIATVVRTNFETLMHLYSLIDSDDPVKAASEFRRIMQDDEYQMRIRVEWGWRAAEQYSRANNHKCEFTCLKFVKDNGGGLMLTDRAREIISIAK